MRMRELELQTTIWIKVTGVMLSERSQMQTGTCCVIPFVNIQNRAKLIQVVRESHDGVGLEPGKGLEGSCWEMGMLFLNLGAIQRCVLNMQTL